MTVYYLVDKLYLFLKIPPWEKLVPAAIVLEILGNPVYNYCNYNYL